METNTEQRTNVTNTTMVPTTNCAGKYSLIGEATFTAVNDTETNMSVIPMIDIILTPTEGKILTDDDKSHLHWTLVDITTNATKTCASPDYTGTFNSVAKVTVTKDANENVTISTPTIASATTSTTALIANINGNSVSKLTFVAPAENTVNPTTKTYRLYVWLDSTYTRTNCGGEVSDPMQNLNISVKWSPSSTMEQSS